MASPVIGVLILVAFPAIGIQHLWTLYKTFKTSTAEMLTVAARLLGMAQRGREARVAAAEQEYQTEVKRETETFDRAITSLNEDYTARIEKQKVLIQDSYGSLATVVEQLSRSYSTCPWTGATWDAWEPAKSVSGCLRVGEVVPAMPRFSHHFPSFASISIPLLLDYERGKGIVIEAGTALVDAKHMAQGAILRLLATVPPAGVKFVFIDPVSLGGNVAGFMGLEKYEPTLIGGKAWSDPRNIENALAEVTSHMETVIQKYLRDDYKSIADYNAKARVKEAYRVVVVFDFPVNFSENATKQLTSIMRNGPKCGVFPIIIIDDTKPGPYGFNKQDLESFATVLRPTNSPIAITAANPQTRDVAVVVDTTRPETTLSANEVRATL
jgi:S-DNA-T family DNA segregation ATPase FtsK/SpoIIIE